jgi:hypothetical protein
VLAGFTGLTIEDESVMERIFMAASGSDAVKTA